ncbi:hypothetical protein SPSIL_012800 [Sporomusa silvacetica DSM 10669]|uniref:Uncharacterized protein n=1 Tax=Sporomusa silvacetica DSM 10669 TaxID=1123289 RepID=A0ABZ3IHL8_9FIRM|nr:hypothetical protein [Sporomusa silvacetica]OZC17426.1 hypothetical protein SPSIL_32370 [Sporomusa silvacetica DSM 10669]
MKKLVIWILVLWIAILLGYGIKSFYFPTPVETPSTETITPPHAPPAKDITTEQEQKPTPPTYQEESTEERQFNSQRISTEKILPPENKPVDLSSQTMSIKKEEKNSLEIMPGVKVKGGGVDISLDKENTSTLELRPNSQNQVLLRQKF